MILIVFFLYAGCNTNEFGTLRCFAWMVTSFFSESGSNEYCNVKTGDCFVNETLLILLILIFEPSSALFSFGKILSFAKSYNQ